MKVQWINFDRRDILCKLVSRKYEYIWLILGFLKIRNHTPSKHLAIPSKYLAAKFRPIFLPDAP